MGNQTGRKFASFFQAGFECSSHRRRDGVRLDLIRATCHDKHVLQDYTLCADLGLRTVRDGLRWHLVEKSPGKYDWSSWLPALEAAEDLGLEVIWDLFHYGSPDHVDQAAGDFPQRFTEFAVAAVEVHRSIGKRRPIVCPLNEINFISWAVDVGYFPPVGPKQAGWLKHQLVRTGISAAKAIRDRWPDAMLVWSEPLVHIAPRDHRRDEVRAAEAARQAQFEGYDWITGRAKPELGGEPSLADVIGVNFYPHNQFYNAGPTIPMGHHEYRRLADMLVEVAERYQKPLFISEAGAEGSGRPAWIHYVCDEVREAQSRNIGIEGICLYPVTTYPGWDNSRPCETGLLSAVGPDGKREIYKPLYEELERQKALFELADAAGPTSDRLRMAG